MKKQLTVLAVLLLSALLLVSCASTSEVEDKTLVTLSGRGRVTLEPDMAQFSIGVSETEDTTAEALAAANEKMNAILAIMKDAGVADDDIETSYLRLSPSYTWNEGERILLGQNASQDISVTIKELGENEDVLAKVIDRLASVDGIELGSISFDASDKEAAYSEARQAAVKHALAKAEDYAAAAGLKLGKVTSISEGYDDSYSSNSMVAEASGVMYAMASMASDSRTTVHAGDIEVSISVNVSVELI